MGTNDDNGHDYLAGDEETAYEWLQTCSLKSVISYLSKGKTQLKIVRPNKFHGWHNFEPDRGPEFHRERTISIFISGTAPKLTLSGRNKSLLKFEACRQCTP